MLLALLEVPDEPLSRILQLLAVDVARVSRQLEDVLRYLPGLSSKISENEPVMIAPLAKSALDNAVIISNRLGAKHVTAAHIFYGIVQTLWTSNTERNSFGAKALWKNNLTPETLKKALWDIEKQPRFSD